MKESNKKKQSNAEKPISLKPLKFDEAVSDLLKVKPKNKRKTPNLKFENKTVQLHGYDI
jgi:hypothetical protein